MNSVTLQQYSVVTVLPHLKRSFLIYCAKDKLQKLSIKHLDNLNSFLKACMMISQLPCVFYVHASNIRIHFGFYECAMILESNISQMLTRYKSMIMHCS